MKRLLLLRLLVFLAAFLLFQVELIIGKAILPGFGGSYMVWSACVFFFQGALLLGYSYAHAAGRLLSARKYGYAQIALVFLPVLFFPIDLTPIASPEHRLPFVAEIGLLLFTSVGIAFFVLSTVSIVTQKILAATDLPEGANPYFLYGTSNLGSFLALLTYPFLVEPMLDLDTQLDVWEIGYVIMALMLSLAIVMLNRRLRVEQKPAPGAPPAPATAKRDLLRWFLFSAAGSAMFLSVTNYITFDVASIPFFWVMPLGIYLLSFVLNFKQKPWAPAWLMDRFHLAITVGLFLFFMTVQGYLVPVPAELAGQLGVLFIVCMYCQKELHDSRPAASSGLTVFYLVLAAGGFAGSALVSWVVPLASNAMIEYVAALLLAFVAISISAGRETEKKRDYIIASAVAPLALFWPALIGLAGSDRSSLVSVAAGIALVLIYFFIADKPRAVSFSLVLILLCSPFLDTFRSDRSLVYTHRNFYGIYHIYDEGGKRWLRHGATLHGAQYLDPARRGEALMYYDRAAPAGELFESGLIRFQSIGIVGLGTGTLSVYARPGQRMDFYELDPDVLDLAQKYFTYLRDSAGKLSFIFGDARQSLDRGQGATFDVLVLDAFSSDAIPVHLLTTQAISDYRKRLTPDGLILFHISNRHLNLLPILYADAQAIGIIPLYKDNINPLHPAPDQSEWVALTADPAKAELLVKQLDWTSLRLHPSDIITRPWTDNYSNLLEALLATR